MTKSTSVLLDLFRLIAALLVFFHHSEFTFKEPWLSPLASFGHDAVVFFFLLSGFVIAHTTCHDDKGWRHYAAARLARIYSVVLPAIALVVALQVASSNLTSLSPEAGPSLREWFSIVLVSLAFLNQSSLIHVDLPTNAAYWSVCYEVWYYVLFGCMFYFRGLPRLGLIVLTGAVAGFPVLLMFPIWLLGFWFYRIHRRLELAPISALIALVFPVVIYLAWRAFNIDDLFFEKYASWWGGTELLNSKLGFSKRFLVDYVTAGLVLIAMTGALSLAQQFPDFLLRNAKLIGTLAGGSFSLYLLHMPLLAFVSMFVTSAPTAMAFVLAVIYLIASVTEKNKAPYVRFFRRILGSSATR